MDHAAVADRLPAGMDAAGWHAIRPNLALVGEAAEWWRLVTGPIERREFADEDRAYLAEAVRLGEVPSHSSSGRKSPQRSVPPRSASTWVTRTRSAPPASAATRGAARRRRGRVRA